jgi:DNA-binding CsgD family transcriptional regulator
MQPTVAAFGYAIFLAVNATVIWGGVFPFLPTSFNTRDIVVGFFLAQSACFALTYFGSVIGTYYFPKATFKFLLSAPAIPYLIGWGALVAAIYNENNFMLALTSATFMGCGTAGFFMAWHRLFSASKPSIGNHELLLGMAIAPILYFCLYLIPIAITTFLIPLIFTPLFCLALVIKSREVDLSQPLFRDQPREHPQKYKNVILDYWRSALSIGSIGFACGIIRSVAISASELGEIINAISMIAAFILAVVLYIIWQFRSLRLNLASIQRLFFPLEISALICIALFGEVLLPEVAGLLYALFSCSLILMAIQCAQAARSRQINPVFIYAFFGGTVYLMHDFGFISGQILQGITVFSSSALTVVSVMSIYVLSLIFFIGQGGFSTALSPNRVQAEHIELITTAGSPHRRLRKSAGRGPYEGEIVIQDRTTKKIKLLKAQYQLSDREAEIAEYVSRGATVAYISEELMIATGTVQTHMRNLYKKLDIHKRSDLINLLDAFTPSIDTWN